MPIPLTIKSIPLTAISKLLILKFIGQAWAFDRIQNNGGYFPYPAWLREYFDKLSVRHWAEFYFEEKIDSLIKETRSECDHLTAHIYERHGANPTNEQVIQTLQEVSESIADSNTAFEFLAFLEKDPDPDELNNLSQEDKDNRRDALMGFQINFYNDLSVAVHGESIVVLVQKAVSENDIDALTKAIQIDRTIIPYFYELLEKKSLQGDSDFFDAVAYRLKNPLNRGKVKHPLLWILFKDLFHFKCLRKGVSSKQILDLYNHAVREFPQFLIEDEQIVRRQRQQFIKKYRLLK